jgi:hypothetical protein
VFIVNKTESTARSIIAAYSQWVQAGGLDAAGFLSWLPYVLFVHFMHMRCAKNALIASVNPAIALAYSCNCLKTKRLQRVLLAGTPLAVYYLSSVKHKDKVSC